MKYQGGLIHDDKWLSIIRDDWVVVVLNYEGYSKGEMIEREREFERSYKMVGCGKRSKKFFEVSMGASYIFRYLQARWQIVVCVIGTILWYSTCIKGLRGRERIC